MARRQSRTGFGDARGQFAADALSAVFAAYEHRCAFTSIDLRPDILADPLGHMLNLSGDPMTTDVSQLIPACSAAVTAFEQGHLALGANFNFLVDLEFIDPELLLQLNPIGRLRLPANPAFFPSRAALTPRLVAFVRRQRG